MVEVSRAAWATCSVPGAGSPHSLVELGSWVVVARAEVAEIHELESGQVICTHIRSRECVDSFCPIHYPSNWPLARNPRIMTPDSLIHRVCGHGYAHPDLDDPRFERLPACVCACDCCGYGR